MLIAPAAVEPVAPSRWNPDIALSRSEYVMTKISIRALLRDAKA